MIYNIYTVNQASKRIGQISMGFAVCPICNHSVPSLQLQRHADDHFADEDYASDLQMAQQVACIPPSPSRNDEYSLQCTPISCDDPGSRSCAKISFCGGKSIDEQYTSLVCLQDRETFYRVEDGLMTLLRICLELELENSVSILSGHVDHFQSIESCDVGWGCGWRNIQMLSSYMLRQHPEASKVLYGGSGFVPNIGSLQRWLELAWNKGFDASGAKDFDQKIYGKKDWVGTTECAALFRSFGLRARIVDFLSKDIRLASSACHLVSDKRKDAQVYGPMDVFLSEGKLDSAHKVSSGTEIYNLSKISYNKVKGQQVLAEWVWKYFSGENADKGDHRVVLSEKSPLYFQHDGHSRTIVGIQAKHQSNTMQYNLLVFDPAERTKSLEASLRKNSGWQKLIKRGVHTLKEPQYQLLFIDPGIASGEELEQLKTLRSICCEL